MTTDDRIEHVTPGVPAAGHDPILHYEIRVRGRLAPHWSTWFDGMHVTSRADGITVITGPVADQSALHGVIQKLRDVGIPLISLTQVPPPQSPQSPQSEEGH